MTPIDYGVVCAEAVALVEQWGSSSKAAEMTGIPRQTLDSRIKAAARMKMQPTPTSRLEGEDALRNRLFELEAQLKAAKVSTLDDEWVKRKLAKLAVEVNDVRAPTWAVSPPRGKTQPGVPTAFWSDWHWGEVVDPKQINEVNEFNLEIAHRRARKLVERVVYLLRRHVVNAEYPGLVLALGGDMLSGDIHDELSMTNEAPLMPMLLDLFGVLKWAIKTLVDEFGQLFVPCVTGNHGRNTKRPRAKDRNFTNFDWLLYHFLAKAFEGDARVQFFIPDGPDALYVVAGHRYLLTHGDQFRGGDGMIGHFGPVLRGQKKKQARNADIGLEFDTLIHGHFHTYFPTDKIIGNGSLKGLDEYAFQGNFSYEPPIQALWLTHPEHGVTIHMPVYLEKHAGKVEDKTAGWVTWKS